MFYGRVRYDNSHFLFIFARSRKKNHVFMKIRIFYLVLAACTLASCVSVQTITFDQLCPAEVSLPGQVQAVGIVNNMPSIPQAKGNVATMGNLNGDGKQTAEAFAGALADSRYFNQVIICDSALNGQPVADDAELRGLSREEVRRLTDDLRVDMLFSLERVFVQNVRKELYYPGLPEPWPVVQTRVTPVLSIYSPVRERPLRVVAPTDSLDWDLDQMPSDKELLEYVADFSAQLLTRQVVPYWEQTSRAYFTGGCVEMRDAAVCVNEGDWEGAKALWLSLYEHRKSGKVKGRAALNLALASEMLGNLEEAKKWMDEAKKYAEPGSDEERVWSYAALRLEKRIAQMSHLNIQMGRFGNNLPE